MSADPRQADILNVCLPCEQFGNILDFNVINKSDIINALDNNSEWQTWNSREIFLTRQLT
jgi:hypothetical protein